MQITVCLLARSQNLVSLFEIIIELFVKKAHLEKLHLTECEHSYDLLDALAEEQSTAPIHDRAVTPPVQGAGTNGLLDLLIASLFAFGAQKARELAPMRFNQRRRFLISLELLEVIDKKIFDGIANPGSRYCITHLAYQLVYSLARIIQKECVVVENLPELNQIVPRRSSLAKSIEPTNVTYARLYCTTMRELLWRIP